MVGIYDINPTELIKKIAEALKKDNDFEMPNWAQFVKTSAGKDRLPQKQDWWYMRVGSIIRKCYVLGPIGVNKLKVKYGCKKNRGVKPEKFYKGSGKIIRVILQQLEKKGYVQQTQKGIYKGRILTSEGRKFINQIIKNESNQKTSVKEKTE